VSEFVCEFGADDFTPSATWPSSIPTCVKVQCGSPQEAPEDSLLVLRGYTGGYVDDGQSVKYGCPKGMKFAGDFDKTEEETFCSAQANAYLPPLSGKCVECIVIPVFARLHALIICF